MVTGVGGHLAQALLPRLLEWPGIEEVVGLDWRPVTYPHPRFRFVRGDIREADLVEHLADVDVVIHMAFVVLGSALGRRRKERNLMRSINLEGSRNLFNAARLAGVAHVIYPSSVAVYGAWPDNPEPLTEDAQRRPMPGFGCMRSWVRMPSRCSTAWHGAASTSARPMRPRRSNACGRTTPSTPCSERCSPDSAAPSTSLPPGPDRGRSLRDAITA